MAKKVLIDLDLNKNQLLNARIQNLSADPSTPVVGQTYFNTTSNKIRTFNGTTWDEYGTSTANGTVTGVSVTTANGFAGTVTNPSTTPAITLTTSVSGMLKGNGTAISAATAGTDYVGPTSGSAVQKGNGAGGLTAATAGTDYAPPTATTSALKGNGSGGFAAATLNDVGAATADYSVNSHKLTNLLDPTSAQDAATKNYVDLAVQGIAWKAPVRAATTTAGTLASSFANAAVIDGVTLVTGDRILIKNQATATENGIYVVAASGAPTRATDADTGAELAQAAVYVREGTTQADSAWVVTNDGTITVGTTGLTIVQFSQSGGVQSASTTISGITRYATTAEAQAKSITTAALTPGAVADFARKFTGTIGDGTSTALAVTHGLGSQFVTAQVYDASTNVQVECDITLTSATQTTFTFATAPTTNAYRVVITG